MGNQGSILVVDDEIGAKIVSRSDPGFTDRASLQCGAFSLKAGTSGFVDGRVDRASVEKRDIAGIDDRIHVHGGNVAKLQKESS